MRPESAALLWDVRAAAERIGTFVSALTEASYREDGLRRSAVFCVADDATNADAAPPAWSAN